jgi:hypothetical protein
MDAERMFRWFKIAFVIAGFALLFYIYRSFKTGYQAGSGLGSVFDIGEQRHQHRYLRKYADTFLIAFPQYKVPDPDPSGYMTSGYEFLDMTKFYFDNAPREIFCIQWEGTGFVSARFAFNCETNQLVIENTRSKVYVDDSEKQRMEKRFRVEVLSRIDSLIAISADRDSAILVLPF